MHGLSYICHIFVTNTHKKAGLHRKNNNLISQEEITIALRIVAALVMGSLIGFERTYHGRPAGLRTHALVCLSSAALMLVTVYQNEWMTAVAAETIRTDPTRMAQGIMTGIGFLGAGVIFKEGLTVRGLTTSASIWITAAIGILIGIGFYAPAILTALATISVLSLFRWIEHLLPSEFYAHHIVKFSRSDALSETELRELTSQYGFTVANFSTRLIAEGALIEYRMVLRSHDRNCAATLSDHLRQMPNVIEFRITPTGD
mgnify:CR=1 FL=1